MKSHSEKKNGQIDKLPMLLGNKEYSPTKLGNKLDCNYGSNVISNQISDFNKYVLNSEWNNEKTIESLNDGEIKRILQTSANNEFFTKQYVFIFIIFQNIQVI